MFVMWSVVVLPPLVEELLIFAVQESVRVPTLAISATFDSDCACIDFEPCGDSVVQSLETCDGSPGCRARGSVDQCTSCGDLIIQSESETCDGSNLANETLPFLTSGGLSRRLYLLWRRNSRCH